MSTTENSILGLKMPTDPRWAHLTAMSPEEILTDHAYCELKAASQCISLIQLHADKTELLNALAPIVTEEWGHFRMVVAELQKRNLLLGKQRKDEYVAGLLQNEPKRIPTSEKLLHKLIICALIEARSCERFRLLNENLEDASLRKFYYKFMVSEAGHYRLFIELAEKYFPVEKVRLAWQHWTTIEENILNALKPRGDRMH